MENYIHTVVLCNMLLIRTERTEKKIVYNVSAKSVLKTSKKLKCHLQLAHTNQTWLLYGGEKFGSILHLCI